MCLLGFSANVKNEQKINIFTSKSTFSNKDKIENYFEKIPTYHLQSMENIMKRKRAKDCFQISSAVFLLV